MKKQQDTNPIELPSSEIAKRLIKHAQVWATDNYARRRFSVEPVLIIERPGDEDNPVYWKMNQAGPCDGDPIQQTIPVETKENFARLGRLIGLALKAEAAAFVSEAWVVFPKRRAGESDAELKARAEAETQGGLSQHPDRMEMLIANLEWIENGSVRHNHIFWKIQRLNGKASVGPMVRCEADPVEAKGRLVNWLCPIRPIPDEAAAITKAILQQCGIIDVTSSGAKRGA